MTERQSPQTLAEDPVETRLRAALTTQAEHDVPSTRARPAIAWPLDEFAARRGRQARPAWLAPLVAAASVVALAAAVVVAQGVGRNQATPEQSTTSTALVVVTDPATPTPSGSVVALGLATLRLPAGWSATKQSSTLEWCLGPNGQCLVRFGPLDMRMEGGISPEAAGGYTAGDAELACGGSTPGTRVIIEAGSRDYFAGRPTEFRRFEWICPSGKRIRIAQYVAITPEPYLLYSDAASDEVLTVMAQLVATASLPAEHPGGLRLYDQGRVRSVTQVPGGWSIELQRAVGGNVNEWTWPSTTTYRYTIPSTLLPSATTGFKPETSLLTMLSLQTDGERVVSVLLPGG